MTPRPGPVYWTVTDVAVYLGVAVGTVSSYHARRQMPPHDHKYGRTLLWRPDTIRAWRPDPTAPRPGRPSTAPPPREPDGAPLPARGRTPKPQGRAPRRTPPPPPEPPTAAPPPRPRYPWETDGPIPPGQPLPRVPGFG